ncbi:MAG: ATP-binding protein [Bryobacteraceae bacterium]|nr:ATP-binding protein [Bryobacteraceae bacterium]
MRHKVTFGVGVILFIGLLTLFVWQGSFHFGDFDPSTPEQRYIFWAISTLVFLLTVAMGFMLFRTFVKLYIERSRRAEGSKIRTKLVAGALALSFLPVFFLVIWSVEVLNRNLDKWFATPAAGIRDTLEKTAQELKADTRDRARALAGWLAHLPETQTYYLTGGRDNNTFDRICRENRLKAAWIRKPDGTVAPLCGAPERRDSDVEASLPLPTPLQGDMVVRTPTAVNLAAQQREIERRVHDFDQLSLDRKSARAFYLQLLLLITLFVLFVATWLAIFLARQISVPITALLDAAREVRRGNLSHRVEVEAVDEMATLVRAFNEMTEELGANSRELERRRRFTEAILESIPTGVISLDSDGRIRRVNRALKQIFSEEQVALANRLRDLFSSEDAAEIEYLMKRARRTGVASNQFELRRDDGRTQHLAVTVSALDVKPASGFVLVLEDTTDLLHAQKAMAWREVARRIAHEIKNPLTPIVLCAQRISRHLDRAGLHEDSMRVLRQCAETINAEVDSLQSLVDEFSQFARFPAAHPVPSELNAVVESALAVFAGRLEGIEIRKELAPNLPSVALDPEQFKRVVVNLVDNAAEAMHHALVRRLYISTHLASPEVVELTVADTGPGVSPEDREKLFLPYFSTKRRGTGLGLAIVSHILGEHNAQIRVESNTPSGARFVVELTPVVVAEGRPWEVPV